MAVVAIWVVLVPLTAVGAVGVPEKAGESVGAMVGHEHHIRRSPADRVGRRRIEGAAFAYPLVVAAVDLWRGDVDEFLEGVFFAQMLKQVSG